jgi:hypothetical protein
MSIDPPSAWRRSSRCSNAAGDCVEVAAGIDTVRLRDSKNPHRELTMDRHGFESFIRAVKQGQFDLSD